MSRNVILFLIVMPLVVFMNCKNTGATTDTPKHMEKPQQESIEFTTLLSDAHSNFTQRTHRVITSQKELNEVFAKINSTRMPGIEVPNVDFNTYEVFFYGPGEVNHGTEGPKVASVTKENQTIVVKLAAGKPQGKYVTAVMSQPAVLIQYKKQELPVVVKLAAQK